MSTDCFSDYQFYVPSRTSPAPADTPYYTPSPELSRSRRSSRRCTPGDASGSPQPPPFGSEEGNVYGLDPKRFTPTLHASLVSEILNLRRELDTKHRFIDDLENNLESTRIQNEHLVDQLTQNTTKAKQAEQRFKNLEDGTFDAVEDLVRQRDRADGANEELKSRLETLNKKLRKQEEQQIQSHDAWEREKQCWEDERRQLERRVHVTETRLRTIIGEMNEQHGDIEDQDQEGKSEAEDTFRDSGLGNESDATSVRSYNIASHSRDRSSISMMSRQSFGSPSKHDRAGGSSNKTLADELDFDEDEDFDIDDFNHNDEELLSDERPSNKPELGLALLSRSPSKARKILGLTDSALETLPSTNLKGPPGPSRELRYSTSIIDLAARMGLGRAKAIHRYTDTGVQPSRSSSPARILVQKESSTYHPGDLAADESTRDSTSNASDKSHLDSQQSHKEPLSALETPVIQSSPTENRLDNPHRGIPTYRSSSTQTNNSLPFSGHNHMSLRRQAPVDDIHIPSITIHPPRSQPASPGEAMLPPGMINASAQTGADLNKTVSDVSVQTEEIRIDQRPIRLPPHLLPSAVFGYTNGEDWTTSVEESRANIERDSRSFQMSGKDSRSLPLKALVLPRPILLPAAREDERLNEIEKDQSPAMYNGKGKSPAYFHDASEESDFPEDFMSDVDLKDVFGTTPGISRPFMRSPFSGLPKTVPEDREVSPAQQTKLQSTVTSWRDSDSTAPSSRPLSASIRAGGSRTGRSGTTYRSRSPSLTSVASEVRPPFPIPTRSSSRAPSQVASEEPSSPTPFSTHTLHSLHSERGPQLARKGSLRKVKSSNTMKQHVRVSPRRRKRSPQLSPIQSMAIDGSPSQFRMPDLTHVAKEERVVQQSNQIQAVNAVLSNETTIEDESLDTGLVDAIAATMVGEWMWKYVRRRKSFGIGESAQDYAKMADDGRAGDGGTRHKRWVWLSPYERTVMWSAKQPNSGSALLGKGGRKLHIKSVLDVKDGTPLSKSAAGSVFDRSILILTPERALKFTASTMERHYLWLTALSFVAQSGRGPPAIPRVPVAKEPSTSQQTRRPSTQRDSVPKVIMPGVMRPRPAPISVSASYADPIRSGSIMSPSDTIPTPQSAAPPSIRRLTAPYQRHQRKRSNTNPQLPTPLSGFLSFSSTAMTATTTCAVRGAASSNASSYRNAMGSHSSSRSSRGTSIASPDQPNFFEAVGTVRMDAFVDPHLHDGVLYVPAPAPALVHARRGSRRRNDSTFSATTTGTEERGIAGYTFDEHGDDPFKGF